MYCRNRNSNKGRVPDKKVKFGKDDNSGDAGLDTSAGWELKTAKPDPILAFTRLVCLPIIITTSTVVIGDVVVVVVALFSGGILQLMRKLWEINFVLKAIMSLCIKLSCVGHKLMFAIFSALENGEFLKVSYFNSKSPKVALLSAHYRAMKRCCQVNTQKRKTNFFPLATLFFQSEIRIQGWRTFLFFPPFKWSTINF